jgi:predicted aspartyl protease
MEMQTVGKVIVTAKIESQEDLYGVEQGILPADQVRGVDVQAALVDTRATILSMPKRWIAHLGLRPIRTSQARTSAGPATVQVYGTVRLTIMERDCTIDVAEVPDDCPVVIDRITLHQLDFVVDPAGQRLIGNPAHGGEHIIELY